MGVLRGFALFVAIIQITGAFAALTRVAFGQFSSYDDNYSMNEDEKQISKFVTSVLVILYIKLLVATSLLLKGILDKRPGFFLYWLIYNAILLCLVTISLLYLIGSKTQLNALGGSFIPFYIVATVFCWIKWAIVFSHYKEVQKETNFGDSLNPYSKFHNENVLPIVIKS